MGYLLQCLSICLVYDCCCRFMRFFRAAPNKGCDPGWLGFKGRCYYFEFENPLEWVDAEDQCVAYGGHLVSMLDAEENAFVTSEWHALACKRFRLWMVFTRTANPHFVIQELSLRFEDWSGLNVREKHAVFWTNLCSLWGRPGIYCTTVLSVFNVTCNSVDAYKTIISRIL